MPAAITVSGYRIFVFAIAIAEILGITPIRQWVISPLPLAGGVGLYTVFRTLHPLSWYRRSILAYYLLAADIAICIFLMVFTGGLSSPFLLYTLTPVLTAALLLSRKVTFGVTAVSIAYVILSQVFSPFYSTGLSSVETSRLVLYLVALCLAAILPYLTNVNLRQRIRSHDVLRERQWLSREMHDGVVQSLEALSWQIQLVQRRLRGVGTDLPEVADLAGLAEEAKLDARACLEFLRSYTGDGGFLTCIRDCLERLRRLSQMSCHLDDNCDGLQLEARVQLELLRICQEALTNTRKHAGAQNVWVRIGRVDGHVEVTISDDGCGFDTLTRHGDDTRASGHGLAVMRERAESVNGRVRVLSRLGQGTEVQIEVPANSGEGGSSWLTR